MEQMLRDLANYAMRHPGTSWGIEDVLLSRDPGGMRQMRVWLTYRGYKVQDQILYPDHGVDEYLHLHQIVMLAARVCEMMDARLLKVHPPAVEDAD